MNRHALVEVEATSLIDVNLTFKWQGTVYFMDQSAYDTYTQCVFVVEIQSLFTARVNMT